MTPTTYSCRAELYDDALHFLALMYDEQVPHFLTRVERECDAWMPTFSMEFRTTLDLESLLRLLDRVPDAHVMQETLRPVPLAENSLERDRSRLERLPAAAPEAAE